MACRRCSPSTTIHALWEAAADATSLPRCVASCSAWASPRALIPPHRPDLNAYVERYHRTFNQECLQVHQPSTLQEVQEVTTPFVQHYNEERPHQGRSCGNQPPRKAFPLLPRLPALPTSVNPDAWLQAVDGQAFARRVGADGCVTVDHEPYYISQSLAKQQVVLFVNAAERSFDVWLGKEGVKRVPIIRSACARQPGRLSARTAWHRADATGAVRAHDEGRSPLAI